MHFPSSWQRVQNALPVQWARRPEVTRGVSFGSQSHNASISSRPLRAMACLFGRCCDFNASLFAKPLDRRLGLFLFQAQIQLHRRHPAVGHGLAGNVNIPRLIEDMESFERSSPLTYHPLQASRRGLDLKYVMLDNDDILYLGDLEPQPAKI